MASDVMFLFELTMCASPVIMVIVGVALWKQYKERNKED